MHHIQIQMNCHEKSISGTAAGYYCLSRSREFQAKAPIREGYSLTNLALREPGPRYLSRNLRAHGSQVFNLNCEDSKAKATRARISFERLRIASQRRRCVSMKTDMIMISNHAN